MCTSWHTDRYLGSLFRVDEPVDVIRIKKTITEFVWKNSDKGQPAEIVPQLTFLIWFNMPLDSNPIQTHSNPFKPTKHSLLRKKCRKVWRFNIYYVLLPWHLQVTPTRLGYWADRVWLRICLYLWKSVYRALCFGYRWISQIRLLAQCIAMVNAPWGVMYPLWFRWYIYLQWSFLTLIVSIKQGNARAYL